MATGQCWHVFARLLNHFASHLALDNFPSPSVACQTTEGEYIRYLGLFLSHWYSVVTLQVHTNIIVACQTTEVTLQVPSANNKKLL